MTVIAYRNGVMAADSKTMWAGYFSAHTAAKVHTIGKDILVGQCGVRAETDGVIAWLRSLVEGTVGVDWRDHARYVPAMTDSSVLLAERGRNPDNPEAVTLTVIERGGMYDVTGSPFFAMGIGCGPAYGALHMGATAEQAVEAALAYEPQCGGPVTAVRFPQLFREVFSEAPKTPLEQYQEALRPKPGEVTLPGPPLTIIPATPYMPGMTLPDLPTLMTGQGDDPDWPVTVAG